jgi:predicted esterase YcpF (UPF0227 family)
MVQPVMYVHGYGSSGNTDTAVNLRLLLAPDYDLISPSYDASHPLEAIRLLEAVVEEHPSLIVVGTSLGGFLTNYLSLTHNLRAVIINPVLKPSASLHKYGEVDSVLAKFSQLEDKAADASHQPARVVVVGLRDDVVDPHTNGMTLTGNVSMVELDMGHRVEPAYYPTIAALVRKVAQS